MSKTEDSIGPVEDPSLRPSLKTMFQEINNKHFGGELPLPEITWNSRLRASAGRFKPGLRTYWSKLKRKIPQPEIFYRLHPRIAPRIEIAEYLLEEKDGLAHIYDTLAHEMIHFWLWNQRRPFGHNAVFYSKMREMGVSRYNTVPKETPHKYLYQCSFCQQTYKARRRKSGRVACLKCCKEHNNGRFHPKFEVVLVQELETNL